MIKRHHKGLLIVFEGTDGTGKSTQVERLSHYLSERGYPVITTREPTDGIYGRKIRELYTKRQNHSPEEELELFLADRKEHVSTIIFPALQKGKIILCDRYFLSTAAYQGAIGFDPERILERNTFAPDPDIALIFRLAPEAGLTRIISCRGDILNDFEQRENLERVAAIFAAIKRPYIRTIDADGSIDEVHRRIVNQITPLLAAFKISARE
ncbi:MAG: dTMP kinase [Desulforhopalus sp.]